jgi:hypothetical protein
MTSGDDARTAVDHNVLSFYLKIITQFLMLNGVCVYIQKYTHKLNKF